MKKELKNYPKGIKAVRWLFPKLQFISPSLAGGLARKLFFTPLKYPIPKQEKEMRDQARKFAFESKGQQLMAYEWGEGPVVLLMHGWSGRGTQLYAFVKPLVDQGYKVVAFDAPGHGLSTGNYSDLVYFSDALITISNYYYGVTSVIAHSMGAPATLLAIQNGLQIKSAVLISGPSIADDIISNFLELVNGSDKIGTYITDHIIETYGKPFHEYSAKVTAKNTNLPALVVHDEQDRDVHFGHAEMLMPQLSNGRLLVTNGLGHTKILRDQKVIESTVEFINEYGLSFQKVS